MGPNDEFTTIPSRNRKLNAGNKKVRTPTILTFETLIELAGAAPRIEIAEN
jgi:hypothetical protein